MTEAEKFETFLRAGDKIDHAFDGLLTYALPAPFIAPLDGWVTCALDLDRLTATVVGFEAQIDRYRAQAAERERQAKRTPADRFKEALSEFEKTRRESDDGPVLDWTPEQYRHAFHRAVVDYYAHRVDPAIEGRLMLDQAELVCDAIDKSERFVDPDELGDD